MVSKKIKKRNRWIAWILGFLTAYVLLVNNSLLFLQNFGINAQPNVVGVIMIFVTIAWTAGKASLGEF